MNDDNQQKSSYLILQQIMDLERLQLSESIDDSCLAHVKERSGGSPLKHDATWKEEHRMLENHPDHSDSPLHDKSEEPLSSPFPQLDSLTNTGNPLNGESFWQYRSPVHNNEVARKERISTQKLCDEIIVSVNLKCMNLCRFGFKTCKIWEFVTKCSALMM